MLKIIRGKKYNTETATEVAKFGAVSLYRKRTGEFFRVSGNKIEPMTISEAQQWVEEKGGDTSIFEVADEKRITSSISGKTYALAKEYAFERGLNFNQVVEKALEKLVTSRPKVLGGDKMMGLDREEKDRSYLFGRLIGLMGIFEANINAVSDKKVDIVNRKLDDFSRQPSKYYNYTFNTLHSYRGLLAPELLDRILDEMSAIFEWLSIDDVKDEPLEANYLLGMSHERVWWHKQYPDDVVYNK